MSRVKLMNDLIEARGFKKYLEIGVDDPNNTFNHINAERVGVDPYNDSTGCHQWNGKNREELIAAIDGEHHEVESDEYFKGLSSRTKFDMVFIDGMHTKEQVKKDFLNAKKHLKRNQGIIVIDDVCPNNAHEAKMPPDPGQGWRGTVWEFWAELRAENQDFLMVVAKELGVGVIDFSVKKKGTPKFQVAEWPKYQLSLEFYFTYRTKLMNERPIAEVRTLLNL